MKDVAKLFATIGRSRPLQLPEEARHVFGNRGPVQSEETLLPTVDTRLLDLYERARNPEDAIELRDLWLGRVEQELGRNSHRGYLAEKWRAARPVRKVAPEEVLASRATPRMVKELFNWFFRDDLYGELRSSEHLILSSGSVDEEVWGLPETLKECIRFPLERDWYGYSDSRGRVPAREAIAAYESERIDGATYQAENVAITMGGTFAISSLGDFILLGAPRTGSPILCGIPNYPPLVESMARRRDVQLVPLPSTSGYMSLDPLVTALRPDTPLVLLQTVANPTGALVADSALERLIRTASPSTMVLLDECHEWLGPTERFSRVRASPNVVRVFSVSKGWSAPGLKVGWIIADPDFIKDYYEYASTSYGGPPSFFYTFVEVLARMERWLVNGIELPDVAELNEFEPSYHLELRHLQAAYQGYRNERIAREKALITLRDASIAGLAGVSKTIIIPRHSINMAVEFPGWEDSYKCFRDLLRETGVAIFPGILTFCLSGGTVRLTTARSWPVLSSAITRIQVYLSGDRCKESV
jgi:aspartate/methionine/tyrosine aminotransferase